jgi:hypothetical protein
MRTLQRAVKGLRGWLDPLRFPGVVSVGVGYKRTAGARVVPETLCIVVGVERKKPPEEVPPEQLIPREVEFEGQRLPTDVVQVGKIRAQALTTRERPCPGGFSCGHESITAGTLGAWVHRDDDPEGWYILSNNHVLAACLSDDTEVLTKQGFRLFRDLTGNEELATLDPDTHALKYHKPSALQRQHYTGPMVHLKSAHVDMLLTPNHRVWARRVYRNVVDPCKRPRSFGGAGKKAPLRAGYGFIRADELVAEMANHRTVSFEVDASASWHCTAPSTVVLPVLRYVRGKDWNVTDPLPIDEWLELLGWYFAEGSAVENSATGQRFISIRNTVPKNRRRIAELARACGFQPWDCPSGAVVVNSKQLHAYLAPLGHSDAKCLPEAVKDLPPEKLRAFLRGYVAGDGCIDKAGQMVLLTKSRSLWDDLQEILLKCGETFSVAQKVAGLRGYRPGEVYYSIRTKKRADLALSTVPRIVPYCGEVFCATVPGGTLFVRRKGKLAWTGNSNEASLNSPILQPGRADGGGLVDRIATLTEFVPIRFDEKQKGSGAALFWRGAKWLPNRIAQATGCPYRLKLERLPTVAQQQQANLVDAAVAKTVSNDAVKPEIHTIGVPAGFRDLNLDDRVQKTGRTTMHTRGIVDQVSATVQVDYGDAGTATFEDQVVVRPEGGGDFSAGGDSGSVVLDGERNLGGLLFAGGEGTTILNRISNVVAALKVRL